MLANSNLLDIFPALPSLEVENFQELTTLETEVPGEQSIVQHKSKQIYYIHVLPVVQPHIL